MASQSFMLVPQQPPQYQAPMQQQYQLPVPQPIVITPPQQQLPVAQPIQGPYADFMNAFSGAFQPVNDYAMSKRPVPVAREQAPFQPAGFVMPPAPVSALEAPRASSAFEKMPIYGVLEAYEKLGNLSGKLPDGVVSHLAANIWYQGFQTPVDNNIFAMPSRPSSSGPEQGDASRKRQRDDAGRFSQEQQQQQPQSSQMEVPAQQPYPQQQLPQQGYPQQQQQQQQPLPVQTPVMIPPGMQLVPIMPVHQFQSQQQQPAPVPTFDANKVKQRLGLPIQQQPQPAPQQQFPQQPQQQPVPQQPQQLPQQPQPQQQQFQSLIPPLVKNQQQSQQHASQQQIPAPLH